MQVLLLGRYILEKTVKDTILKTMANGQAMDILETTAGASKSVLEISSSTKIPLTQVYRWVRKLNKYGFLRVSGATNESGKKYFMYKSKVNSIKITLNTMSLQQIEIMS
ncbi:MAG TPA: ArsR family transcriptional regulator [Nitrosopumilaceae archaeon]|nr:ArsR family transcriptional regulator [Nitrosopumilaceae archaeon]